MRPAALLLYALLRLVSARRLLERSLPSGKQWNGTDAAVLESKTRNFGRRVEAQTYIDARARLGTWRPRSNEVAVLQLRAEASKQPPVEQSLNRQLLHSYDAPDHLPTFRPPDVQPTAAPPETTFKPYDYMSQTTANPPETTRAVVKLSKLKKSNLSSLTTPEPAYGKIEYASYAPPMENETNVPNETLEKMVIRLPPEPTEPPVQETTTPQVMVAASTTTTTTSSYRLLTFDKFFEVSPSKKEVLKKLKDDIAIFNDSKTYFAPTTTPTTTLLSVKGDIARFDPTGTNLTFQTEDAYKLGKTVKHLNSLTTPLPGLVGPPVGFNDDRAGAGADYQDFHEHEFSAIESVAPLAERVRLPTTPKPENAH